MLNRPQRRHRRLHGGNGSYCEKLLAHSAGEHGESSARREDGKGKSETMWEIHASLDYWQKKTRPSHCEWLVLAFASATEFQKPHGKRVGWLSRSYVCASSNGWAGACSTRYKDTPPSPLLSLVHCAKTDYLPNQPPEAHAKG